MPARLTMKTEVKLDSQKPLAKIRSRVKILNIHHVTADE